MTNSTKQTWVFNWAVGGYNSVRASSKAEALALAKALGQGWKSGGPVESSLHVAKDGEVARLDAQWAPFFD